MTDTMRTLLTDIANWLESDGVSNPQERIAQGAFDLCDRVRAALEKPKSYTVAGYYRDNGQPAIFFVQAEEPRAALLGLPPLIYELAGDAEMEVCAIFEGEHRDWGCEADAILEDCTYTATGAEQDESEDPADPNGAEVENHA